MIRKFTLLSVALLAACSANARSLSPEEALARLNADHSARRVAGVAKTDLRLVHTQMSRAGEAAAYVFARPVGFMIVSADDAAAPLLAYGDNAVEADAPMPEQLKWWLGEYAKEIEAASASGVKYLNMAAGVAETERTPIAPLLATKWDQGAPYYNLCPKVGTQYTYSGCVATAMAQVMKYFNYPAKGKGTGTATVVDPSTGETTQSLTMNLGVTFEWDKMLDSYTGAYTSEQGGAVARLMKACGYSVQMAYSTVASNAQSIFVAGALVDNFGYDKACVSRDRIVYPLAEWEQMIYDNLRDCGPVFYAGTAPSGGHAFVCDGYSEDGFFHFNWGWSGVYDGYFKLTALEPEGQGIGGFAGGYNTDQVAIFNIRKPVEGSEYPLQQLTQTYPMAFADATTRFDVTGRWINYTSRPFTIEMALEFTQVNGQADPLYLTLELEAGTQYYTLGVSTGLQRFNIKKADLKMLENGIPYQCRLVTREPDADIWRNVLHPINVGDYIVITRNGTSFDIVKPAPAEPTCVEATMLTPVYYNAVGTMNLRLSNQTDEEVPCNAALAMIDSSGTPLLITGGSYFDLMPGEEAEREISFSFSLASDTNPVIGGTYTLVLYDSLTGVILYSFGPTVCQAAPTPTLTLNSFSFVGDAAYANLDDLNFTANISCSEGYYGNSLILGVYTNAAQPAYVAALSMPEPAIINAGETKDIPFSHIDLTSVCALNTYYIAIPAYFELNTLLNQMDAKPFAQSHPVRFRATQTGIEIVGDDDPAAALEVFYSSQLRSAIAAGPSDIVRVALYNTAGTLLQAPVQYSGASATIDLSAVPAGMAIIVVTDATGNTVTEKIMIR